MSAALIAAWKSQASVLADKCKLSPEEVVRAALSLALDYTGKPGVDWRGIVAMHRRRLRQMTWADNSQPEAEPGGGA